MIFTLDLENERSVSLSVMSIILAILRFIDFKRQGQVHHESRDEGGYATHHFQ
jgi:hypothetical protein